MHPSQTLYAHYASSASIIKCLQYVAHKSGITQLLNSMNPTTTTHNATATMVDASTLTIDTALQTCHDFPQDGSCAICLFSLVPEPSGDGSVNAEETDVVIAKVCGDKHHFHRTCIMAWFNSGQHPLNECPMDRSVLYGTQRVPQFPVNLPELTFFPGHDPEEHEAFYASLPDGIEGLAAFLAGHHPNGFEVIMHEVPDDEPTFLAANPDSSPDISAEYRHLISMVLDRTRESSHEARVSDLSILTRDVTIATVMDLLDLLPGLDQGDIEEFLRIRYLLVGPDPLEGLSFTPPPQATPPAGDESDHFLNRGLIEFWNSTENTTQVESTMAGVLASREAPPDAYQLLASQFALAIDMPASLEPAMEMAIVEYMTEFPDRDPEHLEQFNFAAHAQRFWQMNPQFRPENAPPAEPEQLFPFNTLPDDGVEPRRYL